MLTTPEIETFNWTEHEFEIQCEIFELQKHHSGTAPCKGDPAQWIGWRIRCCDAPPYRLVCTHCKRVYQKWVEMNSYITCAQCGAHTGGFVHFSELKSN